VHAGQRLVRAWFKNIVMFINIVCDDDIWQHRIMKLSTMQNNKPGPSIFDTDHLCMGTKGLAGSFMFTPNGLAGPFVPRQFMQLQDKSV